MHQPNPTETRVHAIIGRAKRAPHWGVQSRFRVTYTIGERAKRVRHSQVCSIENRGLSASEASHSLGCSMINRAIYV